jgi:hypothetical protein
MGNFLGVIFFTLMRIMLLAMLLPIYILLGWWFIPIWEASLNVQEHTEESFIGTVLVFIMAPLMVLYVISTLAQEGIKWCLNMDNTDKSVRKKHKEKKGAVSYSDITLEKRKKP